MYGEINRRFVFVLGLLQVLLGLGLLAACGGESDGGPPTTGPYAPIKASPMFRGEFQDPAAGIVSGADAGSLVRYRGKNRYQLVVTNTSSIGFINTFTWFPPDGMTIVGVTGSDQGDCGLSDGAISCTLALRPPTCTCKGDGGSVTIGFAAKVPSGADGYTHGIGLQYSSLIITSETPVPYIIPSSPLQKLSDIADLPFCKKGQLSTDAKPCVRHG
jgi:hypothetical protein